MRHIVGLGIRGLLLEASAMLLRVHGAFHYRRQRPDRRERQSAALRSLVGVKLKP